MSLQLPLLNPQLHLPFHPHPASTAVQRQVICLSDAAGPCSRCYRHPPALQSQFTLPAISMCLSCALSWLLHNVWRRNALSAYHGASCNSSALRMNVSAKLLGNRKIQSRQPDRGAGAQGAWWVALPWVQTPTGSAGAASGCRARAAAAAAANSGCPSSWRATVRYSDTAASVQGEPVRVTREGRERGGEGGRSVATKGGATAEGVVGA